MLNLADASLSLHYPSLVCFHDFSYFLSPLSNFVFSWFHQSPFGFASHFSGHVSLNYCWLRNHVNSLVKKKKKKGFLLILRHSYSGFTGLLMELWLRLKEDPRLPPKVYFAIGANFLLRCIAASLWRLSSSIKLDKLP